MGHRLGIDLGTTYTAAAVSRAAEGRRPATEIVNLGDRAAQIPSVLHLSPDGGVLVGEAAERRVVTEPDRVVREFKRQVGDPTPIVVDGVEHTAHDLMALLVERVADRVAQRQGGRAERIAVTHPAAWGPHKLDLLRGALLARGLAVEFLDEPRAAAISYAAAERVPPGATVAVYDLGGGTFDAAVVRRDGGFRVLGRPEGIEHLGGVDFDDAVFTHVRSSIGTAFDELDPAEEEVLAAVARLRRDCVEAKEALSADTEVRIPVLLPGLRTTVRLVRGEFEEMIRGDVEASVEALRRAVASAGVEPAELTAVLLVGGSSRIPLVAQLVSEGLGRPVAVDADPKNAIALGAALSVAPAPDQAGRGDGVPGPRRPAGGDPTPRAAFVPGPAAPPLRPSAGAGGARRGAPPGAGVDRSGAHRTAVHRPTGPLPAAAGPPAPRAAGESGGPRPAGRPADRPEPTALLGATARPPAAGLRTARSPRPTGVYLGAGGALVAAALALAMVFWPDPAAPTPTGSLTTTTATPAPARPEAPQATPAPGGAPVPADDDAAPQRRGGPARTTTRATTTADTPAPTTTTTTPPTTTAPPTTTTPPPATTEPPASPASVADGG
jgi:actin-like ATPase involved in cell morphogenesis